MPLKTQKCPHCSTRIVPSSDGTCPCCQLDVPQELPAIPAKQLAEPGPTSSTRPAWWRCRSPNRKATVNWLLTFIWYGVPAMFAAEFISGLPAGRLADVLLVATTCAAVALMGVLCDLSWPVPLSLLGLFYVSFRFTGPAIGSDNIWPEVLGVLSGFVTGMLLDYASMAAQHGTAAAPSVRQAPHSGSPSP